MPRQQLTIAPVGLFTDPNPLSAAPDGAMTEALNVVIQRPGVIEPRPGFQAQSAFTAIAVDEDIVRIIPFEDDLLVLTKDASDGTGHAYWYSANDDMVQTGTFIGSSSAFTFTVGQIHGAAIGGNLYITCGEGVFRCTAPGDDTAARAGIPRPPPASVGLEVTGGQNYPFAAGSAWAYRACETLTAGKLTIRSAPSSRFLERSYTGSAASNCLLTFARTPSNITEVYRSVVSTTAYTDTPSDELTGVGSAAASSASFTDDASSTGIRGASLYANATQDGALLENGMPPICRDVATFRNMMFFAGAERAPSLTFEIFAYGPDWRGGNQSYSDRLTYLTCSGGGVTVTSGSNTITGLTATQTSQLRVGMRVCDTAGTPDPASPVGDAQFAADTYITAVGATTVTLNNNATGNGTDFIAFDWIELSVVDAGGATTKRVFVVQTEPTGVGSEPYASRAAEFIALANEDVRGPQQMAYKLSKLFSDPLVTVSAFGDGVTTPWTFVVESFAHDVTSVTVKISNSGASPDRIDKDTGKTATRSGSVATLAWSKMGEPEHCPPPYTTEIGASDKAIERIVAARDSLFVFKEDGVWRVSGYSPDTLQVDEFDRTMRLVHPDACCEWDGAVAAWTNKGVMLLGSGGAQEISLPIANLIRAAGDIHAGNAAQGVFMCGWLDRGLLLLGIPASTSTGSAEYVYCWSQRTGAWTRWNHDKSITTAAAVGDTLYLGTKAASAAAKASILASVDDSYDTGYSVTVATVTGTAVTIDAGSGWTPAVGDLVGLFDQYAITAVASATAFTVHTTGLGTGATIAVRSQSATVTFTVRDGDNPGAAKLFRESALIFGKSRGASQAALVYESDRSPDAGSTVSIDLIPSTSVISFTSALVTNPRTVRTRIPREVRRCGRMSQAITLYGAMPSWELHGVSYVYEPVSTRFRDAS